MRSYTAAAARTPGRVCHWQQAEAWRKHVNVMLPACARRTVGYCTVLCYTTLHYSNDGDGLEMWPGRGCNLDSSASRNVVCRIEYSSIASSKEFLLYIHHESVYYSAACPVPPASFSSFTMGAKDCIQRYPKQYPSRQLFTLSATTHSYMSSVGVTN
jgi:hypothetical protein